MSPNEFQFRAALREGEGEQLDAGTVLARARAAQAARHARRVRYGSVAASAAIVAGIGVAGAVVLGGGPDNRSAGKANRQESTATRNDGAKAPAAGPVVPHAPGPLASAAAVPCPATLPHPLTPGGGGTDQFGAGGSLFSGPVAAIKICAYAESGGPPITAGNRTPLSTVLTGERADQLEASLDGAPKTRQANPCPLFRTADGRTLVIIGVSADGKPMPPILATVAQNPCNLPVTNGTAIRYGWTPPAALSGYINEVRQAGPLGSQSIAPSGKIIPSPIQS